MLQTGKGKNWYWPNDYLRRW